MDSKLPRILQTRTTEISTWLTVISRDVQMSQNAPIETYDAIGQPDYIVVLAVTADSHVLLVRQFRPALERFSLEFPAGLRDPNEDPEATAIRELFEETGYRTKTIELIGKSATCAGRISNATYSYFVHTANRDANFVEESGIIVSSVTWNELSAMILSGEFNEQTHLGVLTLAAVRGLISF